MCNHIFQVTLQIWRHTLRFGLNAVVFTPVPALFYGSIAINLVFVRYFEVHSVFSLHFTSITPEQKAKLLKTTLQYTAIKRQSYSTSQ
jgi:hypothetical protein